MHLPDTSDSARKITSMTENPRYLFSSQLPELCSYLATTPFRFWHAIVANAIPYQAETYSLSRKVLAFAFDAAPVFWYQQSRCQLCGVSPFIKGRNHLEHGVLRRMTMLYFADGVCTGTCTERHQFANTATFAVPRTYVHTELDELADTVIFGLAHAEGSRLAPCAVR